MKQLRCIGGPAHGRVIALTPIAKDAWLIDETNRKPPTTALEAAQLAQETIQPTLHYTGRVVSTPEGSVHFLAFAELSDIQALRIALGTAQP